MNPIIPESKYDELREQARTATRIQYFWHATRSDWKDKDGHNRPLLNVYIGPDSGVLTCSTPAGKVHTTGGPNNGPVICRTDNNGAHLLKSGAAIPIDQAITAIREFASSPNLPESAEWTEWDVWATPMVMFDDEGREIYRIVNDELIEAE